MLEGLLLVLSFFLHFFRTETNFLLNSLTDPALAVEVTRDPVLVHIPANIAPDPRAIHAARASKRSARERGKCLLAFKIPGNSLNFFFI